MGVDIHVRVVKFNKKKNAYEEVKLYRKNDNGEFVPIDFYFGRDYELFDLLNDSEYFPNHPIHIADLPLDLKKEIEECQKEIGYYSFLEANLAEVKLYLKDHPQIRDWNEEEDEVYKDNPVKDFIKTIEYALDFADDFWYYDAGYAGVRILYWFDC